MNPWPCLVCLLLHFTCFSLLSAVGPGPKLPILHIPSHSRIQIIRFLRSQVQLACYDDDDMTIRISGSPFQFHPPRPRPSHSDKRTEERAKATAKEKCFFLFVLLSTNLKYVCRHILYKIYMQTHKLHLASSFMKR